MRKFYRTVRHAWEQAVAGVMRLRRIVHSPPGRDWCRLLRLPNLFTVPGDPLAGAMLAILVSPGQAPGFVNVTLVCAAAVCLYAAGLVNNDLVDIREDRRRRPERPLASGRISVSHAVTVAAALTAAGLILAFAAGRESGITAIFLTLLIAAYNFFGKNSPVHGPWLMGACRGFSLLLGAALLNWPFAALLAALAWSLYIRDVTLVAATEATVGTRTDRDPAASPAFFMPALVWLVYFLFTIGSRHALFSLLALIAGVIAFAELQQSLNLGILASGTPARRSLVGRLLRGLILWQLAFVLLHGTAAVMFPAALLIFCKYASTRKAAEFSMS